ncbi:MAG: hypothetical protein AB8B80_05430 [Marinicellaceae bacterium]
MTQSVKTIVIIIGFLSIASGIYLVIKGSDFSEYFSGIFLGVTLIGTAVFYKDENDKN